MILRLIKYVEWPLVLKAAALAALAFLAARLIDGGLLELLSLFAGFGGAGYLATHRALSRPLVQGVAALALALGALVVGIAITGEGLRRVARAALVVALFATAAGTVGMLAGRADRELRPRRGKPDPLAVDDLSRTMGAIFRGRKRAVEARRDRDGTSDSVD